MQRLFLSAILVSSGPAFCGAVEFKPPARLTADGAAIRVESPGYAAPCWADLNGNGKHCLLVGQFNQGKIRVFEHVKGEEFSRGTWLRSDGKVAEVPGVW